MDIKEKDFIVTGHKVGVIPFYVDVEPELVPKRRGETVLPATHFYEGNKVQFTLWAIHEPGERFWPQGGYEISDASGGRRCFDLNQVIVHPKSINHKPTIEKMRAKNVEETDENEESVKVDKGVEVEDKPKNRRGRPALSPEAKIAREAAAAERSLKSSGRRGRPKSDKPKEVVVKQPSGKGRGRPALSEEAKLAKEKEKAERSAKSSGKRGRPKTRS